MPCSGRDLEGDLSEGACGLGGCGGRVFQNQGHGARTSGEISWAWLNEGKEGAGVMHMCVMSTRK